MDQEETHESLDAREMAARLNFETRVRDAQRAFDVEMAAIRQEQQLNEALRDQR